MTRFFRYLVIVCATCLCTFFGGLVSAEQLAVALDRSAVVRSTGTTDGFEVTRLPPGAIVEFVAWHNSYKRVRMVRVSGEIRGYMWHTHLKASQLSKRDIVRKIQENLSRLGYNVGVADGLAGAKTTAAMKSFFTANEISAQPVASVAVLNELLIINFQENLEAENRAITKEAEQRKIRAELAQADNAFRIENCEKFSTFSLKARRGRDQTDCKNAILKRELIASFKAALSNAQCQDAQKIALKLGSHSNEVKNCFRVEEERQLREQFSIALANQDCELVRTLEISLKRTGSHEACKFSVAMSAKTARQMFLAAGKYDAGNERAKAKLLYTEIVDQFADDDLALQAVTRLTALNDLERSEQASEKMEVEMARLKQEAEAAQRVAEAARRQADAARVEAQRRPVPSTPSYPGGFRPGDSVYLCMKGGNHISATVVRNPTGSQMEIRPNSEFFIGSIFNPTNYYRNRDYFFDRTAFAARRSDCR